MRPARAAWHPEPQAKDRRPARPALGGARATGSWTVGKRCAQGSIPELEILRLRLDPRDPIEPRHLGRQWLHLLRNRARHPLHRLVVEVDLRQQLPQQEALLGAQPPGQRRLQLRPLLPHAPARQVRQHRRVRLARQQCVQHRPRRDPGDVGRHAGQLDIGLLQQLLQPVDHPRPVGDHGDAMARQGAQLALGGTGHEAGAQQPVGE